MAAEGSTPCLSCGACCAGLRVSFYWGEGDDAPAGWVPVALTTQVTPQRRAMAGTERMPPRCVALDGAIGVQVACRIYAQRPSPCREFNWHGEGGHVNARCNQQRARHGLPALPDPVVAAR